MREWAVRAKQKRDECLILLLLIIPKDEHEHEHEQEEDEDQPSLRYGLAGEGDNNWIGVLTSLFGAFALHLVGCS
jgi:hypothetical protein